MTQQEKSLTEARVDIERAWVLRSMTVGAEEMTEATEEARIRDRPGRAFDEWLRERQWERGQRVLAVWAKEPEPPERETGWEPFRLALDRFEFAVRMDERANR